MKWINAVLLCQKKKKKRKKSAGMHWDIFELIWSKLGMMVYYRTLHFDTSLKWPLLSFKITGIWESNNFCTKHLTKVSVDLGGSWHTVETFDMINLIPILSRPVSIHGRESCSSDWVSKFNVGWRLNIYRPISFMKEASKLYILIPVWMTLASIQGHSLRNQRNSALIFLQISQSVSMGLGILPQSVGLLDLKLNLFCMFSIQERERELY